jgi:diguanylate cyclase (GGDEF)-like protein
MPREPTAKLDGTPTLRELLAIAALAVVFLGVSVYLELFEWLVRFPIHHPGWHIPEISGAILFASIGLVALEIRRRHELREANSRLAQLCWELEREKLEMGILNEMADLLQSCLDSEEASRIMSKLGGKSFPYHRGGIYLLRSSRNILEPGGTWKDGDTSSGESPFSPADCWALRRGLPHLWADSAADARCTHLDASFEGWSLCVPLAAMGETIGLLHLRVGRMPDGPVGRPQLAQAARDELFAIRFAAMAATALANLHLRETLRYQSVRDPLTGLFNRRYLEDLLELEIGRAVRKLRPLSLIMLDADHFKHFNDTYGHEAGDNVLRALASVFTRAVRKEDLACRYGGEEFILVMPEAALEIALTRAHRIREEVRRMVVSHAGRALGPITVSAGVASFPDHAATTEALVAAADAALYQAKAQGRDRVVLASLPQAVQTAPPAPAPPRHGSGAPPPQPSSKNQ